LGGLRDVGCICLRGSSGLVCHNHCEEAMGCKELVVCAGEEVGASVRESWISTRNWGGENKRLLAYFFAVCLALAIFTATGTAIAMITGVMPGAKSMPSPAILTASKYGDALEWLGQLKLSSSLRRLTLLDSWKASKKLRKVY
jgi:hypothetical protein